MHGQLSERLNAFMLYGINPIATLEEPHTKQLVKELGADGLEGRPHIPQDTQRIIKQKVFGNRFRDISAREWRLIPYCLWDENPSLIEHENLFTELSSYYAKNNKRSNTKALIWAYLTNYNPERKYFKDLGRLITSLIENQEWAEIWRQKHTSFNLFDSSKAHVNLAKAFTSTDYSISDFMESVHENWETGASPLFAEIFREACRQSLNSQQKREILLTRIMEWAVDDNHVLRYPFYKAELVNALLLPWLEQTPEDELKEVIKNFLLHYFDDPRLKPAQWATVSQDAADVMFRWLAEANLRQFFAVVDEVANANHWGYRKAFWESYLKFNMEAWVVFGPECERVSHRLFGKDLKYSRFKGSGNQSNHAVLIMKIGDLIITEWSHDGACRMYHANSPEAPKMYQPKYEPEELKNLKTGHDGWFRHSTSPKNPYLWQPKFADYIRKKTGYVIDSRKYRL